jgi:signal transduction histidine kinase
LAPAAAKGEICLSCDCQPDLPAVPFDQQRILQVMTNIITNAITFTPAGGQIRVSLSEAPSSPECIQVAVRDSGRGIPAEHLDAIFTRLYQVNGDGSSSESRSGLGLGLYICRELVHMHGGRIWVDSQPGQGSTFTFTIPKRQAPADAHPNVPAVHDEAAVASSLQHALDGSDHESEDSRR